MIFSKNNIGFRQVSSNAQANFLKSKSFVLAEVTSNGGWQFSKTAKEVLLQTYRIWSIWLFDLEEYIVKCNEDVITEEMFQHCEKEITRRAEELDKHTRTRLDWYEPEFMKVVTKVRDLKIKGLKSAFRQKLEGQKITSAYNDIVGMLINYMNHLMFNLHEIDYLLYCDRKDFQPFIYIDNTDVNLYLNEKEFFPSGRLCLYQKLGLMGDSKFTVKLGISPEYLRNNTEVDSAYTALLLNLRTHDAHICCVV